MMTLKEKTSRKRLLKWIMYVTATYLLASWGVNSVICPLHYMRSICMKKMQLEVKEQKGNLVIALPSAAQEYGCLSFQIVKAPAYSCTLHLTGKRMDGDAEEMDRKVWKGWNFLDISAKQWSSVEIMQMPGTESIQMEEIIWSPYPKMDTQKMISVQLSYMLLAVFWECVRWVKRRYAS